jgi:hypothetical protein
MIHNPALSFAESGLAATIIEAPIQLQQTLQIPSFMDQQCSQLGLPFSGNAAGHNSTTDFSGLTTGPGPEKIGWFPRCVLLSSAGRGSDRPIHEQRDWRVGRLYHHSTAGHGYRCLGRVVYVVSRLHPRGLTRGCSTRSALLRRLNWSNQLATTRPSRKLMEGSSPGV